jgi:micrococcal nuclease
MKNKIILGVIVVLLMTSSFFAGVYFEKQKLTKELKALSQNPTPLSSEASAKEGLISQIQEKLTVVEVTDGDTLKLSNGKTFRLYGVNAPEKNEKYFKEAVDFTKQLTLNKEITFEQEERYKEDKFGRILGYLFVDGKNLNIEIVKVGLAKVVLYEKRAKIKYQDKLVAAELEAKAKKLGIWNN